MPVFDITAPDGTHYTVTGPDGSTEEQALQQVQQQHTAAPAAAGAQPSTLDRIVASPVGRFAHDVVGGTLHGAADALTMGLPVLSGVKPGIDMVANALDAPYQASLARNRNAPGYAAQRATADQAVAARGGSGFTDQMIAPLLPTLAGTVGLTDGLDSSNANADAQAAAQGAYAKAHPVLSFGAGLLGGMLAGPEAGLPKLGAAAPKAAAPSIASLRADATAAYNRANSSGVVASAPSYDAMVGDLQAKLASEGIDPTLHPNATAAAKRVVEAQGAPIDIQGLETQRRIAGHAIEASTMNKADRRMAHIIQDHIDDYVGGLQPADLVGGTNPQAAAADLTEARDLYSRSAKASTIQSLIDKAGVNGSNYTASGLENSLRVQFRKLANNDRAMRRFSPDEQSAIKRVATGGSPVSMNNALRYLGKFSPQGFFPAVTEMGAVALGGPSALAIPAAGFAGRVGATAMTRAAAQRAVDLAARGRGATAIPATPALQLPQLPPQLPLGMFGSAAMMNRQ